MSACLGSKAYARPASERGEKATHETKQTRSRGDALRIWGSPPKSPTAGPTANCGPAGPRSKAQSRGRFALIESERLLLMQRRCRSPQHERRPSSTGTPRLDNSPGHQPPQASQRGWVMARAFFLAGLSSAPAKRHRTQLRQGRNAALRWGMGRLRSALWMPSLSSVIS